MHFRPTAYIGIRDNIDQFSYIPLSLFQKGKLDNTVTAEKDLPCNLYDLKSKIIADSVGFLKSNASIKATTYWSLTVMNVKIADCYQMDNLKVEVRFLFLLKLWSPPSPVTIIFLHFTATFEKRPVYLRDNRTEDEPTSLPLPGVQRQKRPHCHHFRTMCHICIFCEAS